MHLETAQLAPVSEPTLSLTIEARLDRASSTLVLLLPYAAIAPVADRFTGREDVDAGDGRARPSAVRAPSGRRRGDRARRGRRRRAADRAGARAAPGDVLHLDARADAGVTLYADEVPVHRAEPGRSGSRRAVQVTERLGRRAMTRRRRARQARPVHLGGRLRRPRDVRARDRSRAGDVAVVDGRAHPLEGMPVPAVATKVSYVDGVTGGNVFVMTLEGAGASPPR